MIQLKLSSHRRVLTLLLASALATTGAFATTGGVAAAAPTAKVPVPAPTVPVVQQQNLGLWLGGIRDGTSASTTLSGGYILTASRVGGQKVITVKSSAKLGVTPAERFPFCVWIVSAAIYGVGAGLFGLAAALGWEIVLPFGVVVSPWLAGVIAASLAAGASINALVGAFLC
jgi:hypothetical protein